MTLLFKSPLLLLSDFFILSSIFLPSLLPLSSQPLPSSFFPSLHPFVPFSLLLPSPSSTLAPFLSPSLLLSLLPSPFHPSLPIIFHPSTEPLRSLSATRTMVGSTYGALAVCWPRCTRYVRPTTLLTFLWQLSQLYITLKHWSTSSPISHLSVRHFWLLALAICFYSILHDDHIVVIAWTAP